MSSDKECPGCGTETAGGACPPCTEVFARAWEECRARRIAREQLKQHRGEISTSAADLVAGTASSICRDPDEWWSTGYRLVHGNGIEIWFTNGPGYLKITIPGRGDLKPTWRQRRALWRAVRLWLGRPLPDFWRYNPCRPEEPVHRA